LEKAKAAADLITNVTGSKDVTIKHLDLASLKSVRSFAEDINKNENKLDIMPGPSVLLSHLYYPSRSLSGLLQLLLFPSHDRQLLFLHLKI
jgi:hypothetical protein